MVSGAPTCVGALMKGKSVRVGALGLVGIVVHVASHPGMLAREKV